MHHQSRNLFISIYPFTNDSKTQMRTIYCNAIYLFNPPLTQSLESAYHKYIDTSYFIHFMHIHLLHFFILFKRRHIKLLLTHCAFYRRLRGKLSCSRDALWLKHLDTNSSDLSQALPSPPCHAFSIQLTEPLRSKRRTPSCTSQCPQK